MIVYFDQCLEWKEAEDMFWPLTLGRQMPMDVIEHVFSITIFLLANA